MLHLTDLVQSDVPHRFHCSISVSYTHLDVYKRQDIKLCLHIQILHRNVVSVFYGYMITFPSYVFCDRVT